MLIQFVTRNYGVDRGETTAGSAGMLIVQERDEEAAVDRQPAALLGHKAKLRELIHEITYS